MSKIQIIYFTQIDIHFGKIYEIFTTTAFLWDIETNYILQSIHQAA